MPRICKSLIAVQRLGRPEIAAAVACLASPKASYITGVTLHVNGRFTWDGLPAEKSENRAFSAVENKIINRALAKLL